jgi:hypothetical protein
MGWQSINARDRGTAQLVKLILGQPRQHSVIDLHTADANAVTTPQTLTSTTVSWPLGDLTISRQLQWYSTRRAALTRSSSDRCLPGLMPAATSNGGCRTPSIRP